MDIQKDQQDDEGDTIARDYKHDQSICYRHFEQLTIQTETPSPADSLCESTSDHRTDCGSECPRRSNHNKVQASLSSHLVNPNPKLDYQEPDLPQTDEITDHDIRNHLPTPAPPSPQSAPSTPNSPPKAHSRQRTPYLQPTARACDRRCLILSRRRASRSPVRTDTRSRCKRSRRPEAWKSAAMVGRAVVMTTVVEGGEEDGEAEG